MPRTKKITLDEIAEALKDPSIKKDLEIFNKVHEQAKKAGLDKMTMEEIDKLIKRVREKARKEAEAKVKA